MKKLLIIPILFLFSFKTDKDYWALIGTVKDFEILKSEVLKAPDDSTRAKVLNWIDHVQRIQK